MCFQDTLPSEMTINADKQILNNTDYNMLKAFEHILQADSLDELMLRIKYAREHYAGQLELRQHCRNEINESEITLVEEQKEREIKIQEMLGNQNEELQ